MCCIYLCRAYVVPSRAVPQEDVESFALGVQDWVAARVAPHKKLRGGIVIVTQIPKRWAPLANYRTYGDYNMFSVLLGRFYVASYVVRLRRTWHMVKSPFARSCDHNPTGRYIFLITMLYP